MGFSQCQGWADICLPQPAESRCPADDTRREPLPGDGSEQGPGTGVTSLAALPASGASPGPKSLAFTRAQAPGAAPVLDGLSRGWAAPSRGSRVEGVPWSPLPLARCRGAQHRAVCSVL